MAHDRSDEPDHYVPTQIVELDHNLANGMILEMDKTSTGDAALGALVIARTCFGAWPELVETRNELFP